MTTSTPSTAQDGQSETPTKLSKILDDFYAGRNADGEIDAYETVRADTEKALNANLLQQIEELIDECFENNDGYIDDKLRAAARKRYGNE